MNVGSKQTSPLSATRMIMWIAFGTFWIRFRVRDCEGDLGRTRGSGREPSDAGMRERLGQR